jgi:hypothetical protein
MQSQPKGMQWGGMYPISDEQARYLQTQVRETGEMLERAKWVAGTRIWCISRLGRVRIGICGSEHRCLREEHGDLACSLMLLPPPSASCAPLPLFFLLVSPLMLPGLHVKAVRQRV